MPTFPFSRAKSTAWVNGDRISQAQIETIDSQQAQAADGNVYTDLAIAKNWYDAAVTLGADYDEVLVWNPGDRLWYFFGADGSSNPQGLSSYSGRANTFTVLTIPAGSTLVPAAGAAAANSSGVIIFGGNAGSATTKIRESANGTTWNARSTVAGAGANVVTATWHSGASLFIVGLDNTATTNIETSPNGQTWTQRTGLPNSDPRGQMCSNGTIVVILPGASTSTNKCLTTTNGTSYTERTLPTTQVWRGVIWDPRYSRFLAFGASNWAHSADGISWTDGGANPVSLGGNSWPNMGVVNIGRAFIIYGVGDDKCYAGYYDGTMHQWLVLDTGDHVHAAASDGQFMVLNATALYRTFAGGA